MKDTIDIKTTEKNFYYNYIKILTPVINKICHILSGEVTYIREAELKILSLLMYYYVHAPYKEIADKNRYIFNMETSYKIMDDYKMKVFHYHNTLGRLRKYGIITGKRNKRTLHPLFYMNLFTEKGYALKINFMMHDKP